MAKLVRNMRQACLLLLLAAALLPAGESVTVFAAASLGGALTDIAKAYTARTGVAVVTSCAGSSTLARQIENGAPADVFISADERWMDRLASLQLIDAGSRSDLLGNALVVIAPAGKAFALTMAKDFPAQTAFAGRIALGDPAAVPAGIYAKESFVHLGWWPWLEGRVAPAADVRAALRLVESAEVDCGVVYATDAKSSAKIEVIATIPEDLHAPVRYPAAVLSTAGPAPRAFLAALHAPEAAAIFVRHGFTVLP